MVKCIQIQLFSVAWVVLLTVYQSCRGCRKCTDLRNIKTWIRMAVRLLKRQMSLCIEIPNLVCINHTFVFHRFYFIKFSQPYLWRHSSQSRLYWSCDICWFILSFYLKIVQIFANVWNPKSSFIFLSCLNLIFGSFEFLIYSSVEHIYLENLVSSFSITLRYVGSMAGHVLNVYYHNCIPCK